MEQTMQMEAYLKERYGLAMGRIHEICTEETVPAPFSVYFHKTAEFLIQMGKLKRSIDAGETRDYTLQQWERSTRRFTMTFCRNNMRQATATRPMRWQSWARCTAGF